MASSTSSGVDVENVQRFLAWLWGMGWVERGPAGVTLMTGRLVSLSGECGSECTYSYSTDKGRNGVGRASLHGGELFDESDALGRRGAVVQVWLVGDAREAVRCVGRGSHGDEGDGWK
jgi:hypothetical protein